MGKFELLDEWSTPASLLCCPGQPLYFHCPGTPPGVSGPLCSFLCQLLHPPIFCHPLLLVLWCLWIVNPEPSISLLSRQVPPLNSYSVLLGDLRNNWEGLTHCLQGLPKGNPLLTQHYETSPVRLSRESNSADADVKAGVGHDQVVACTEVQQTLTILISLTGIV